MVPSEKKMLGHMVKYVYYMQRWNLPRKKKKKKKKTKKKTGISL